MSVLPQRFAASPLLALAAATSIGILAERYLEIRTTRALVIMATLAAISCGLATALMRARKLVLSSVSILAAFVCAGIALGSVNDRPVSPNHISRMIEDGRISSGDPVEVTGIIQGEPEPAPASFYLTLKTDGLNLRGVDREARGTILLLARNSDEEVAREYQALALHHGARVRVMTTLEREDNYRSPGVMPFTEYLEREGYDATGIIKSPLLVERLDDERVFLPLAWVYEWRAHLQQEFSRIFSAETAGVVDAALLGNPYNISAGAAQRFRSGGTFHILVISGLQIAFVAGLALILVRRITRRKFLQFLMAGTFLWAYTIAVGAQPSVARAALMFTLAAFAPIVARRSNSLNSISGAALLLLIWNPATLFDPSFQLTFLSVLSIVCVAVPVLRNMQRVGAWQPTTDTPYPPDCQPWFRRLSEMLFWSERNWRAEMATSNVSYRLYKAPLASTLERFKVQRLLRFVLAAVVISASVQVVLLPAMILYFHRVSIASLVLNIVVGILMAIVALAALAAVLASHVSSALAWPLIFATEKANWLMIHLVDPFSRLGLASFRLTHYHGKAAAIYAIYLAFVAGVVLAMRRWDPLRPSFIQTRADFYRNARTVLGALTALTVLVIIFHPLSATAADGKLHIDFLDVGQGDSALITTPEGVTVLIDGGGRPNIDWKGATGEDEDEPFQREARSVGERVVSEFLWSRGLDSVDYVIATHADADHIDGLIDVMRNFKVRTAIVARTPPDNVEFTRFAATAKEMHVPVEIISAGDRIRLSDVEFDVLWPPASPDPNAPSRNNDSIVLRTRFGQKRFLFTGDVEKEAEAALVNAAVDLRTDIVKVAHHGSRTSSTAPFVNNTRAPLAIISVGRTSIFGHPNKEVVERWRASGAQVMTTGEKGTISVVTDGRDWKVSVFVP